MQLRAKLGAVVAAAMLVSGGVAAQETLRFGHIYETSSVYHEWVAWAAEEIGTRTEGRYKIEVFPAGSIGNENDLFQGLSLGTVDIALSGSFYTGGVYGPMALSSAPFMYRDLDHWKRYRDSDLYAEIVEGYESASGNHVLSLMYYGSRHLTANREITSPEDLKGMKLRVPNTPMYTLFPRSVGANPTPIDFAEVYLALQQGVVDGQENPLPTILSMRFFEVQSHIMLTGHIMDSLVAQVSGRVWNDLDEADQAIFEAVFDEMAEKMTEAVSQSEDELVDRFRNEFGINVIAVDREPFREAMQPLLLGEDLPWTREMVERVNAM